VDRAHRRSNRMIMNKLEIDDLASLVKFAIRHGVTSVQ
jgi:hypothetical protein